MEPYKYNPVFVIFMNDSPEFVWIGGGNGAHKKMEELAKTYWEKNKATLMSNNRLSSLGLKDGDDEKAVYKDYRSHCYWHIHNVNSNTQSPQG